MGMLKPTEITITIDTECSVAEAFIDPEKYKPVADDAIMCAVDGEEHGVGFLLDTFQKYNIKASFFIECAHYFYFGDNPMKGVVRRIIEAGQDTQLHVHPCWMNYIDDPALGTYPTDDSCINREYDELRKIFELTMEVFQKWTGRRPEALRTGSLVADLNIYKVMSDLEIPIASNVAIGLNEPDEKSLQLFGGRQFVEGIMELPVFSYQDMNVLGRQNVKSLQITSCSWPEMEFLLRKARKEGVENIVILTHPFEFIKKSDPQYSKITRNRVNQERLIKLCKFIADNNDEFMSCSIGQSHQRWLEQGEVHQKKIDVPSYFMVGRKIHNKLNDTIWGY